MSASTKAPYRSRAVSAAGVVALLAVAAVLRAWGLDWGLPDATRFYPYHPDETVLLDAVSRVNPLWLDFTPGFYNYGSLYILLCRLVYDLAAPTLGWGTVPRPDLPFEAWVADFAHLLFLSRCVTVALGVGTVLATLTLGRKLYGERAGWIAAGFLTVAPLPVLLGHYMTVDVPSTFFVMLALALGAAALAEPDRRRMLCWIAGAGFAAGLATGTKYNCFPALFPLAVPLWRMWREDSGGRRAALAAGIGAVIAAAAAFLLSTPGALLDTERFLRDLLYEMGRNREGQGLIFRATPPSLLYHLVISLPVGLEWPLFLLAVAGLGWSLHRRRAQDVYLWLFVLPFFLLLVPAERKFLRYVTPLMPPLVILAARLASEGLEGRRRRAWIAGVAVCGAAAAASTVAHLGVLAAPDARDQAAAYLREHASTDQTVALASDAWYYTPPIHPTAGAVKQGQLYGGPPVWDLAFALGQPREDITALPDFKVLAPRSVVTRDLPSPAGSLLVEQLEQYRPEWVVISDYEYEDPERIRKTDPRFEEGRLDLLAAMQASYHLEREFRPRPSLFGFTWWRRGIPPHDWRYYMPTIRIYRRNG